MTKSNKKVEKFLSLADGKRNALILPHNYADPDAIASAMATRVLLDNKLGLKSTIAFEGVVGREENRVMYETLGIDAVSAKDIDFGSYDFITLVDCQPGTGNNALPESVRADAVIDHHPAEGNLEGIPFIDVRGDVGASSTILAEYLFDSGVKIRKKLATALLYGIKTDALNIAIKTTPPDIEAYMNLFPLADKNKLSKIEGALLPKEYFSSLNDAIANAGTYDRILVSDLKEVSNPGIIGEFADLFLRVKGVDSVLCFGVHEDKLLISIRTLDPKTNAGKIIRYAVGKRGTAGGHATMAGGQIQLIKETQKERTEHIRAVLQRVFNRLGIEGKRKRRIV